MGTAHDNFQGHTLLFEDGETLCKACNVKVSWESWAQHIHGKDKDRKTAHLTNLEAGAHMVCSSWRVHLRLRCNKR